MSIQNAGQGYNSGDVITILGGGDVFVSAAGTVYNQDHLAKFEVTEVSTDVDEIEGQVKSFSIISTGSFYSSGIKTCTGGNGSNLTVDVTINKDSKVRTETVVPLDRKTEQDNRVIYELIASDTVETTTYAGVGISTDENFVRPVVWRKQVDLSLIHI